jgi:hypothetical protein
MTHHLVCHVFHFKMDGWQVTYRGCAATLQAARQAAEWFVGFMGQNTPS